MIQILGAAVVSIGVGLIWFPLGVILAGASTLVFGIALERNAR